MPATLGLVHLLCSAMASVQVEPPPRLIYMLCPFFVLLLFRSHWKLRVSTFYLTLCGGSLVSARGCLSDACVDGL